MDINAEIFDDYIINKQRQYMYAENILIIILFSTMSLVISSILIILTRRLKIYILFNIQMQQNFTENILNRAQ